MSGIKDKVVVITGASSGIGEAATVMLAERGAKVVLGARGLDRLEALARRIAGAGGEAAYAQTDVRKREDLTSLVNLACERYGKLDVLINNAGIGPISPLDDLRVDDWENMIDINIKGVLYGIAAALPVFRKQGFGHFVNTASTAGIIVNPNMAVYAGTKFSVRAISEGLRQEAGDKLRVTIISPGFVNTNFTESMTSPEIKGQIRDSMDKMGISPDAIARAMVFAIEQPADVDVGRDYCPSHGAELVRGASRTGAGLTVINPSREGKGVSPHFLNRSDSGGSVFRWIVGLGKNCGCTYRCSASAGAYAEQSNMKTERRHMADLKF